MSKISAFSYRDYKTYMREWINDLPKGGRGEMGRIAAFLRINSVNVSQILKGSRHFTTEQALTLSQYLSLSGIEADYFVYMIAAARSGSKDLENFYLGKMDALKLQWANAKSRIVHHKTLSDDQKATFYSNWLYSAVRLLASIKGLDSAKKIADRLKVPESQVATVIKFLIEQGLCKGTISSVQITEMTTFIDKTSPIVGNHHRNWRLKAIQQFGADVENDLFYSSPVTISRIDQQKVKDEILNLIERFSKRVKESDSEELMCINIDWFKV
jgi:uncharacterized protein (TIGR02147 family)